MFRDGGLRSEAPEGVGKSWADEVGADGAEIAEAELEGTRMEEARVGEMELEETDIEEVCGNASAEEVSVGEWLRGDTETGATLRDGSEAAKKQRSR
ncbi:hypothetical protein BGZ54_004729 [Gamsiella multidivaricata]|nr:hypothetical protein BGZ54_004729 [Gamsiella multidivaricata]